MLPEFSITILFVDFLYIKYHQIVNIKYQFILIFENKFCMLSMPELQIPFTSLKTLQEIIETCIKIMLIQKNETHLESQNRKVDILYTQTSDYIKIDLHRTSQNADIYIIICSLYYKLKALIKSPVIIIITSSHNTNYSSISS